MEFTDLFRDDDAVSPVIGVILMVAITVILAAVIGTFVLGLGDELESTSPQASFTFDFDESASGAQDCGGNAGMTSDNEGALTITHDGGDSIEASQLSITGNTDGPFDLTSCGFAATSEISAGTTVTTSADDGDTVRVIWESSNGGDTATLGKWTGPDA